MSSYLKVGMGRPPYAPHMNSTLSQLVFPLSHLFCLSLRLYDVSQLSISFLSSSIVTSVDWLYVYTVNSVLLSCNNMVLSRGYCDVK